MADEGTDVSNIEQLSFCIRSVDDDLNVSEDFIGFYELENIKSETIVNAIKDILLRSQPWSDLRRSLQHDWKTIWSVNPN